MFRPKVRALLGEIVLTDLMRAQRLKRMIDDDIDPQFRIATSKGDSAISVRRLKVLASGDYRSSRVRWGRRMEPVVITISHSLGKDEAVRRLRPALTKAAASFPILTVEQEVWEGDRMTFRVSALGQSAAGTVEVVEGSVRLEIRLPWLLARFVGAIRKTIESQGQVLLGK